MQETVLELKNYSVSFDTPDGEVQAVRNVDLSVKKGEILCIVGESQSDCVHEHAAEWNANICLACK